MKGPHERRKANNCSYSATNQCITKTFLYNLTPLNPTCILYNLGLQGYALFSLLFLLKNIDCGYSLEPAHRGGSNEYQQFMSEQKYEKYQIFLSEKKKKKTKKKKTKKKKHFLVVKFSVYLNSC